MATRAQLKSQITDALGVLHELEKERRELVLKHQSVSHLLPLITGARAELNRLHATTPEKPPHEPKALPSTKAARHGDDAARQDTSQARPDAADAADATGGPTG